VYFTGILPRLLNTGLERRTVSLTFCPGFTVLQAGTKTLQSLKELKSSSFFSPQYFFTFF